MCRKHLSHHLPFWLFSTEVKKESISRIERGGEGVGRGWKKEEGARDLWWKRHGPAQSCHSLSNYNTSNNSAFSQSQLQISPLGCRLPVPSLLCAGRGCVCMCVRVCRPLRVGNGRRADGRGPSLGGRWQFSSHITRQTSKPTVVIWCDVDSNCLWCCGVGAGVERGRGRLALKW